MLFTNSISAIKVLYPVTGEPLVQTFSFNYETKEFDETQMSKSSFEQSYEVKTSIMINSNTEVRKLFPKFMFIHHPGQMPKDLNQFKRMLFQSDSGFKKNQNFLDIPSNFVYFDGENYLNQFRQVIVNENDLLKFDDITIIKNLLSSTLVCDTNNFSYVESKAFKRVLRLSYSALMSFLSCWLSFDPDFCWSESPSVLEGDLGIISHPNLMKMKYLLARYDNITEDEFLVRLNVIKSQYYNLDSLCEKKKLYLEENPRPLNSINSFTINEEVDAVLEFLLECLKIGLTSFNYINFSKWIGDKFKKSTTKVSKKFLIFLQLGKFVINVEKDQWVILSHSSHGDFIYQADQFLTSIIINRK